MPMPPESADISVIIPAWRAASTIGRALVSVATQTLRPREVIVIDDGSDDGTADVSEKSAELLCEIELTVLRRPHQGPGAARNAGLARASGRYVAFLDADDEWLPEKLAHSLAHFKDNDTVFVSHDMIAVAPDGHEVYFDCARHFVKAKDPFVALFKRGFVATSTVVARREALLEAGGFDPDLPAAQDYDLWLTMAAKPNARFHVFTEALTRYHQNPGGITANVERRRSCSMTVLCRHAPTVRGREGAFVAVLARTLIVHYEAFVLCLAQGRIGFALGLGLKLIPALVQALAAVPGPSQTRQSFVS